MAAYTITVDDKNLAAFETFCAQRGKTVQEFCQFAMDGFVKDAVAYSVQTDEAAKAAAIAAYELVKPMTDKYAKLAKEDQAAVDLILAKADAVVIETP